MERVTPMEKNASSGENRQRADGTQRRRPLIKGHCELCSHYLNCPRMEGKDICYGKKEQLTDDPPMPADTTFSEEK